MLTLGIGALVLNGLVTLLAAGVAPGVEIDDLSSAYEIDARADPSSPQPATHGGRAVTETGFVERLVQRDAEDVDLRDAHVQKTRTRFGDGAAVTPG